MTVDFSIIIPTRNRKDFLKVAIESIVAQQDVFCEIIVVDDASTDDTPQYIAELRDSCLNIKYIRNEKSLFAHNSRREGYKIASGIYIVFMDDDDFYTDNYFFSKAKNVLIENKNIYAVFGATTVYENENDMYGATTELNASGFVEQKEYINNFGTKYAKPLSTLTAIFRKDGLNAVSLENSKMINDTCIYLYGLLAGDVFIINSSVAAYRVHESNISKRKFALDFMKDCLDEKRRIYNIAKERQLLCDSTVWYYKHLKNSIYYFLSTSGMDIKIAFHIIIWLIKYGKGVRFKFVKGLLRK